MEHRNICKLHTVTALSSPLPTTHRPTRPAGVQIYDASDFSLLCASAEGREAWRRGEFLSADRVIVWADSGRAYIYRLPPK